jgi:hypothetical protein
MLRKAGAKKRLVATVIAEHEGAELTSKTANLLTNCFRILFGQLWTDAESIVAY